MKLYIMISNCFGASEVLIKQIESGKYNAQNVRRNINIAHEPSDL